MNFSIIIPAKNEERNIGRCLESIARIDWPRDDFEVLLVDNGSSDRTVEIARSLGAAVFVRPGDTVAGLRNFGAGEAKGRILVFLDADCTVVPSWLRAASVYLEDTDLACFGSPPVVPPRATWVQKSWFEVRRKKGGPADARWLESMNMFVRREYFERVGGFNRELVTCEDYDLSLRLKRVGRIVADERIVAVHHGEAASVGHFFRKELWRGTSNFKGTGSHGWAWKELPSLALPAYYGVSAAISMISAGMVLGGLLSAPSAAVLAILWQGPFLLLAAIKAGRGRLSLTLQLYVLFNIYFAARAGALLPRTKVIGR